MAKLREKIDAEFENLERVVQELPQADAQHKLSSLELSGVAVLVHNFYNGAENILKQISRSQSLKLPEGPSWHGDLLASSRAGGVISDSTAERLKEYLGFSTSSATGMPSTWKRTGCFHLWPSCPKRCDSSGKT